MTLVTSLVILGRKKFFTFPTKNFARPTLRVLIFGDSDLVWWFPWPKWWFCGKKFFWVSGSKKCLLIDRTARAGFFKSNFRPIMWLSSLRWSNWQEKKFHIPDKKFCPTERLEHPLLFQLFQKLLPCPILPITAPIFTSVYIGLLHRPLLPTNRGLPGLSPGLSPTPSPRLPTQVHDCLLQVHDRGLRRFRIFSNRGLCPLQSWTWKFFFVFFSKYDKFQATIFWFP